MFLAERVDVQTWSNMKRFMEKMIRDCFPHTAKRKCKKRRDKNNMHRNFDGKLEIMLEQDDLELDKPAEPLTQVSDFKQVD